MSSVYRLFGVDFQPARLDIENPRQPGETGFTTGSSAGFSLLAEGFSGVRDTHLLSALNLKDDGAWEFEEHVKFGDTYTIDFIRDFLAGYEHAAAHMRTSQETLKKLAVCLVHLGTQRLEAHLSFHSETEPKFSKIGDFLIEGVGHAPLSILSVIEHGIVLKGDKLFFGPEHNIEFNIHKDNKYDQDVCRGIHAVIGSIVDQLYRVIEEQMFDQYQQSAIDYIRNTVEKSVRLEGCVYPEPTIPNFYTLGLKK